MSIAPKNWATFQHYKDRSPAWIKLHRGLLDDFAFSRLPVASRALAPLLWLLASEYEEGKITASLDELAFRLRISVDELLLGLRPLIGSGFFNASEPLADCYQNAIPEKRREREENIDKRERRADACARAREDDPLLSNFNSFWDEWPNKVGKPAALKAFNLAIKRGASPFAILGGLRTYIRDKPPDRQWLNPATFLNQNRWEDQPATVSAGNGKHGRRTVHDAADDLLKHVRALEEADRQQFDSEGEDAVRKLSTH